MPATQFSGMWMRRWCITQAYWNNNHTPPWAPDKDLLFPINLTDSNLRDSRGHQRPLPAPSSGTCVSISPQVAPCTDRLRFLGFCFVVAEVGSFMNDKHTPFTIKLTPQPNISIFITLFLGLLPSQTPWAIPKQKSFLLRKHAWTSVCQISGQELDVFPMSENSTTWVTQHSRNVWLTVPEDRIPSARVQ